MAKSNNSNDSKKVTFGKKSVGKHIKQKNAKSKSVSVYRGQGRS
jgi:hypothetical protein